MQKQFYIFSKDGAVRYIQSKKVATSCVHFRRDAESKQPQWFRGLVVDGQDNSLDPSADYDRNQVITANASERTQ
jgi:hypothetical protein